MPVLLVAATQRTKDLVFAQNLASQYQLVLEQAQNAQSLRNLLVESRNTLVLWDVDHPGAQDIRDPMSSSTVARELKGLAPADRVIALSDKPLTEMPYLPPVPPFNHHLFRSKAESALQLYMRVSMASMIPDPFGAAQYAPEGTAVQRITLKRASQRKAAVEAVQNVYQKRGGHARLAAML
jgi:hypothetical protein